MEDQSTFSLCEKGPDPGIQVVRAAFTVKKQSQDQAENIIEATFDV